MKAIRCGLKGASAPFRYTNSRRMAEESSRYRNDVPPSPPDESTNTARYAIIAVGLALTAFIVVQPKNDYNGTQNAILEAVYKNGENAPKN
jgi:hypothetical protein